MEQNKVSSEKRRYTGSLHINSKNEFILVTEHIVTNLTKQLNNYLMSRVNIKITNNFCCENETKDRTKIEYGGILMKREFYSKNEYVFCIDDICLDDILVGISKIKDNNITVGIEDFGMISEDEMKYIEKFGFVNVERIEQDETERVWVES